MLSKVLMVLALASFVPGGATERWKAASTTASSITGDVTLRPDRIVFSTGASLPIRRLRAVTFKDDLGLTAPATLYRVPTPADPVLLHGNRICGGAAATPVTYLMVWPSKPFAPGERPGRALAAYSSRTEPAANASAACAVFRYDL